MLERYPEVKVVATAKALAMLGNFFEGMDFASCSIAVCDGDTLELGRTVLSFCNGAYGALARGDDDT